MKRMTGRNMRGKRLALFVALVMFIVSIPFVSTAAEVHDDGTFKYQLDTESKTATVTGYLGETEENNGNTEEDKHVASIPEKVAVNNAEYKVTAIGDRAFENNRSITKVTMPDTVTSIGANAFNCCPKLQTVVLSNGLTELKENAFFSCTRLQSVRIRTADGTEGTAETLSDANVVTLPASLTTIGAGAFYDCLSILAVDVQGQLGTVGKYVFGNCLSLGSVHFDENKAPVEIGDQMFMRCESLTDINLPEGIQRIGTRAFYECWNLTGDLGAEVKFSDGEDAGQLKLPDSVESIGDSAFCSCMSITRAYVPNCTIGERAFRDCAGLTSLEFTEKDETKSVSDAEPDIGNWAFASSGLKTIEIPQYVDEIEDGALAGCKFTAIDVNGSNHDYESVGGVLFDENKKELIAYPAGKEGGTYTIPNSVTTISGHAFTRSDNLTGVSLPSGLSSIGDYAFENCINLASIDVPDNVSSIGEGAFHYCNSLNGVALPQSMTAVKAYTFEGCEALTSIRIPDGVTDIEAGAFADCHSLKTVEIPSGVTAISPLAFNQCEKLSDLDIDAGNSAFTMKDGMLYSKDLKTVLLCLPGKTGGSYAIPEGTTAIGNNAFSANTNIKEVIVPASVTDIGDYALGFVTSYYEKPDDRASNFYIVSPSKNAAAKAYAEEQDVAYFTGTPADNANSVTLASGETFTYTIENAPVGSVLFTSSDESIAAVDRRTGVITGVSKGDTYIVASTGTFHFICSVTVTSGEKPAVEGTEYTLLNGGTYQKWVDKYKEYNEKVSFDFLDNSNLVEYTGDNYIAILAKTQGKGGKYVEKCDSIFGVGGYDQYSNIAENLSLEIGRYTLDQNLVTFRGTNDVSQYTVARTSRLKDMYDSIGKTIKTGNMGSESTYDGDWVASTSIDHGISYAFGYGVANHTVLEIYAPADYTRGAYVDEFSNYSGEFEILLDGGTEFEVIDAGVRLTEIQPFAGYGGLALERYMKLQITGVKGEESRDFGTPIVVASEGDPIEPETYEVVVDEDITITHDLQENGFDDADKIRNVLYSRLMALLGSEGFNKENTVIWDVKAVDENGDIVPSEELPAGGFKIVIPYPEQVENDWEDHDFTILHMFGENRSTRAAAGDIEGPMAYKKTEDGLEMIVTTLSPFAIHWSKAAADNGPNDGGTDDGTEDEGTGNGGNDDSGQNAGEPDPPEKGGSANDGSSQMGDASNMLPWLFVMTLAALIGVCVVLFRSKNKA